MSTAAGAADSGITAGSTVVDGTEGEAASAVVSEAAGREAMDQAEALALQRRAGFRRTLAAKSVARRWSVRHKSAADSARKSAVRI